jgi:hypothetical protein
MSCPNCFRLVDSGNSSSKTSVRVGCGASVIDGMSHEISHLKVENARLRELLKSCRSYITYEVLQVLDYGGVPVEHVKLIEEIDQAIGPPPGGPFEQDS